ncbi:gliding motility-associated ABC transporter permease subunit GldF [Wenyingzhuangia fucanilytica]|uniref:Gliding motility-associated ABC transporter permease subunit GldF n=1 Tax=Wenyingzhuangia fucanilytica TaxID=1790137 RepID=A0A1B1Y2C5_9FLAO|nr:gliding motility-associated ABC transporter permease subunit GldF [Wenyingzhuangia fucanilytica]ANW94900.1 gliding motility-associated ABC transporter permease subunit GldF [Wenyingzhuangia fucanilytica]
MKAIFNKEIQSFFSHAVGYLLVSSFLIINGLLLWVFKGYSNVIYSGFANINAFFNNSSWVLALLIPAITMKSFADEYNNGTLEILKTLPISHTQIILGKFWAYIAIIIIALIPSLVFVYSTYQLGNPVGNIDLGSTFASYLGLILLSATYIAIGIFSSIIMKNNISAFILSILINTLLYFGFSALENLSETTTYGWNALGIPEHFNSISRGVIDTTDLVYFISISFAFLALTKLKLDHE